MSIHMMEERYGAASPRALGILLIAPLELIRVALKQFLSATDEVYVIGEADPGPAALELARRSSPNIAIIDADRLNGELNGFMQRLMTAAPGIRPIILSDDGFEDGALQALQLGAWACLPRDISQAELIRTVRQVARGGVVIDCILQPSQVARLKEISKARPAGIPLTDRESAVVRAMAAGGTDVQISRELGVALPTIKTHVRAILRKTKARNRAAAVATAFRSGLLT